MLDNDSDDTDDGEAVIVYGTGDDVVMGDDASMVKGEDNDVIPMVITGKDGDAVLVITGKDGDVVLVIIGKDGGVGVMITGNGDGVTGLPACCS